LDIRRLSSIYIDIPALRPGTTGAYALAAVLALAALVARLALDPYIGGAQYITFFPVVMTSALISGFGAGLVCTALSLAAVVFFILPPRHAFYIERPGDVISFLLFTFVLLAEVTIAAGMRFTAKRYQDLSRNLEQRVEDRTAEVVQRNRELDEKNRQLHEANDQFAAIYQHSMYMARLDLEGTVVDVSRASLEDCGFTRDEVVGRPFWECGWWNRSPEVRRRIREGVEQALAAKPFREESTYFWADGTEHVVDVSIVPIRDDIGRVAFVSAHGLDVTGRARQYQATFENAAVGIAHASADLRWLRVNEALRRTLGYPANELIAKPVLDVIHPDYREAVLADIGRLRDGKSDSYEAERRYLRKDGATVWIRASVSAVRKGDGSVDLYVGVMQDISARKQAQELMRRQADLLNQSHDAILTWRIGDRCIVYWSRGAEMLYGYTTDEATGRIIHELLRTRAIIPIEDVGAQVVQRGSWYGELTHTTRDGREIVVESRIVRVTYDGETFGLETNRDITERKRAEEQVRLLLREMSHRGKNMLALVQAVARQTAASDPEHFIERFTDRIQALAANQDLLVRTRWKGVEVGELACAQLAHFSDIIGHKINLNGPKLWLNGVAAQAIGMALHELATNASKYGALSTDAGHVDIGWRVDGGLFKMHWIERDGPLVRAPDRRGFGSTVIEAMAERAVDGDVQLEYDPAGVAWHLTCPKANALTPGDTHDTGTAERTHVISAGGGRFLH
jgi:PAS domain S-box-containing protein